MGGLIHPQRLVNLSMHKNPLILGIWILNLMRILMYLLFLVVTSVDYQWLKHKINLFKIKKIILKKVKSPTYYTYTILMFLKADINITLLLYIHIPPTYTNFSG